MSSKTIKIDPKLFQVGSASKKKKNSKNTTQKRSLNRQEKKTLASVIKPNKAKKELLKLIREKQKRDREKMLNEERKQKQEDVAEFTTNFQESMEYIQKVLNDKNKAKTLKNVKTQMKIKNSQQQQSGGMQQQQQQIKQQAATNTTHPQIYEQTQPSHIPEIKINNNSSTINIQQPIIANQELSSFSLVPKTQSEISDKKTQNIQPENISTQEPFKPTMPSLANKPEPPYGCLKGGTKPTYKQYNKTLKKSDIMKNVGVNDGLVMNSKTIGNMSNETLEKKLVEKQEQVKQQIKQETELGKEIRERREKLRIAQQRAKMEGGNSETRHKPNGIKTRFQKYKVKTIKKTYKLGKYKDKKQVGVLIKNNSTRKKVKFETGLLSKTPMPKIKKYLREKNMIKHGSQAPDSLLKKMFTESMLSGDVTNKSKDVLIHNYFNKES